MLNYSIIYKNPELINNFKSTDKITLTCINCQQEYLSKKSDIQRAINGPKQLRTNFCSNKCYGIYKSKSHSIQINCKNCNIEFTIQKCLKKKNNFCSKLCSIVWLNQHRPGNHRSKLEKLIEVHLLSKYDFPILFNDRKTINSELDIYIPSLKLAFELNGIFHYEPIKGSKVLQQIQFRDKNKFQRCSEQSIALCVIDTSKQSYVTNKTSQKYIDIIDEIIQLHLQN